MQPYHGVPICTPDVSPCSRTRALVLFAIRFAGPPVRLRWRRRECFMTTGEIKGKIDRLWDAFWSSGISNPLEAILSGIQRGEEG